MGKELYTLDKNGKKIDAIFHEEMLAQGPGKTIEASKAFARKAGLTEEQVKKLYP